MAEETHPLPPFLPSSAKLLMLGSFPPPRQRWTMDFYYPNINNDMWRIMGLVFFGDKNRFIDSSRKTFFEQAICHFLKEKGIAVYDAAFRVQRLQGNASDQFLQIMEPVDLAHILLQIPHCQHIATTGELATHTLLSLLPPPVAKPAIGQCVAASYQGRQLQLHRLPSSSRAYPLALERKAAIYAQCFAHAGLL